MSWNVIGGITWSKVTPFYLFISFYIFLNLFISFYIFLYRFSGEKMFFMILNVIFWFLDHQNHVVSNLLRPAALFSLADIIIVSKPTKLYHIENMDNLPTKNGISHSRMGMRQMTLWWSKNRKPYIATVTLCRVYIPGNVSRKWCRWWATFPPWDPRTAEVRSSARGLHSEVTGIFQNHPIN